MDIRTYRSLALVLLVLAPATASADQGFTYTGLEAGYNTVPASDGQSATGWYSAGTFQLPRGVDAISLSGAYYSSSDYGETTASLNTGLNYHWSLSDDFDLVSDTLYCRNTITTTTRSSTASGYTVDGGFHTQLTAAWDINVVFGRQKMDNTGVNFVQIAPVLDLGNSLSLSLAWLRGADGSNQFTTGIRYDF